MRACVGLKVVHRTAQVLVSMGKMDSADAELELSAADLAALEAARRAGPTELVALAWAPAEHEGVLRQVLAMGANRLVRIATPLPAAAAVDPLVVAAGLAEALAAIAPEVVFFGEQSPDEGRGAVGPMVAALLGWPCLTGVVEVAGAGPDRVRAWARSDPGATAGAAAAGATATAPCVTAWSAPLPAVLTVDPTAPRPAKPGFLAITRAFKAPIETVLVTVRPPVLEVTGVAPGTERARAREVLGGGLDEALSLLSARLRERRVF